MSIYKDEHMLMYEGQWLNNFITKEPTLILIIWVEFVTKQLLSVSIA
jgi:hypothetical protein